MGRATRGHCAVLVLYPSSVIDADSVGAQSFYIRTPYYRAPYYEPMGRQLLPRTACRSARSCVP